MNLAEKSSRARDPAARAVSHLIALAAVWVGALGLVFAALNGASAWVVVVLAVVLAAIGTVGIVGVGAADRRRDLGEVERAGEELARAEAQAAALLAAHRVDLANAQALLDSLADPVLATDPAGWVIRWNRAAAVFFDRLGGRAGTGLAGLGIDELFSQAEILGMHSVAAAGTTRQGQVKIARQGVNRIFQVLATPASLDLGPSKGSLASAVVITLRDVTDLATAVQLKTDFVANASHELRTPLASIRAAVETMAEPDAEPAMMGRFVQMIATNVGRLEELTRDLVDLSRLESPEAPVEIGPVSVVEMLEGLRAVFEPVCVERKLLIECDVWLEVAVIESDPRALALIFKNLLENATKFAYEGTTVRVVGRVLGDSGAAGGAGERERREGASFEVIDSGIGIPLSHQPRIFERFYQSDSARSGQSQRRGTGLGLAIVKHAVKSLGGSVSVSSVWKQGTTMRVELPRCLGRRVEDLPSSE